MQFFKNGVPYGGGFQMIKQSKNRYHKSISFVAVAEAERMSQYSCQVDNIHILKQSEHIIIATKCE